MDIELSPQDQAFQREVREFLEQHAIRPGEDALRWRQRWFTAAAAKGGWDVPKWPKKFGGPGWTPGMNAAYQFLRGELDLLSEF